MISLKPLTILTLVAVYNVAVVWGLWRVGYWDVTMLYDTVMFIMVGAIGSVFAAVASGVAYDRRFFLKTILVNLGIMVLLAFLVDLLPSVSGLSSWSSFPLATLLTMLVVVARYGGGRERTQVPDGRSVCCRSPPSWLHRLAGRERPRAADAVGRPLRPRTAVRDVRPLRPGPSPHLRTLRRQRLPSSSCRFAVEMRSVSRAGRSGN